MAGAMAGAGAGAGGMWEFDENLWHQVWNFVM